MDDVKMNRRQRTQKALQEALTALLSQRHYDEITIQDITDHANLGRTTFYQHFQSKDALFLSIHQPLRESVGTSNTRDMWLNEAAPSELVAFFAEMKTRGQLRNVMPTRQNSESSMLLGALHRLNVQHVEANLHKAFDEPHSSVPFHLLAQAMVGVQIWLAAWWMDTRNDVSAQTLAQIVHRLQHGMLVEALRLAEAERKATPPPL
jgi:AcrR family transcriptional regulator